MPDSPVSAKWLSEREKAIAIKRVTDDQLGVKNSMTAYSSQDSNVQLTEISSSFQMEPTERDIVGLSLLDDGASNVLLPGSGKCHHQFPGYYYQGESITAPDSHDWNTKIG